MEECFGNRSVDGKKYQRVNISIMRVTKNCLH